ncbi:hypothetical protein BGZ61DRAFT_482268 [Ilyonectria robusta]|uniref:uncharacterized protein n=1 Tax=Ilyonectria robusta TaxID=1079257 RepID=UPI001E8E9177|nr:uncharacterized protein BGZ61DRAFT_482268 [Ilyonectria robusta]KAH6986228.1 hypothetical protein BKA56DRAFT_613612 [Ilyonectria sp. MPI-CAGE-AT-0026]KAH8673001.1 hypothetical protein BGZ61DRAFT_482268 [Ilyonectria robusta]
MAPSVYILFHRDSDVSGTSTIVSVFSELQDANAACLQQAAEAKVEPKIQVPREPLRWEAPDGTACWVEKHAVVPRKTLNPVRPESPKRKDSSLYDNDEDDVIEVQDQDGHYD